MFERSDEPLGGPTQEFDFDTDDEGSDVLIKKTNLRNQPLSNTFGGPDDSGSSEDEDEPITMANMEARSRALDVRAAAEAKLDAEEFRVGAASGEDEDYMDIDRVGDEEGDVNAEPFHLPTTAERESEKQSGGPDLDVVQRRIKECVRVLGKFSRLAEKGR